MGTAGDGSTEERAEIRIKLVRVSAGSPKVTCNVLKWRGARNDETTKTAMHSGMDSVSALPLLRLARL